MSSVRLDSTVAEDMVNMAVRTTAQSQFYGNIERTVQEIQGGNCEVCGAVSDCLARQVGTYLGGIDRTVKAVFRCEPEYATPRQVDGGAPPLRRGGINLVAWVGRKNAALASLGATLESLLAERRKKLRCPNAGPACTILDIQMVEDKDVLENRGPAVVVNSLYLRSVQMWKRPDTTAPTVPIKPEASLRDLQARIAVTEPASMTDEELFSQAQAIEKLPLADRRALEPRLQEIKVALIRRLLSDQPGYIEASRQWLTIPDLVEVSRRRIGFGRIGGEAAGLVLASRILRSTLEEPLRSSIQIPESYYLGADLFYTFMAMNRLMRWNYQKYKTDEQIRSEYPLIRETFRSGEFPPEILQELRSLLNRVGRQSLIVRSSSLLEDSFGSAFAGKYEFILCPNQATPEQNLQELVRAIASVYASTLCPEALLYRRIRGLRDYDERMGILIQPVMGERLGRYYLPTVSGVALSRNLYRWSPHIRSEDGFVRMVWGLGTSAVERAGNNPPRLVALSHPAQEPPDPARPGYAYRQKLVDVIDLQENCFKTLPVEEVISPQYAPLRLLAQRKEQDFFSPLRGRILQSDIPDLRITFQEFLSRTDFAEVMAQLLHTLESVYHTPVDLGFTAQVEDPDEQQPQVVLNLLHCRRQDFLAGNKPAPLPVDLPPEKTLFQTGFMVPRGHITGIRHVLFIPPETYYNQADEATRQELRLAIYQLNTLLGEKQFICLGPGQWGAANPRLGVYISYADIYNAAALVELYGQGAGPRPDPALGTYAFQDLMEARIYPLTVSLDAAVSKINHAFLNETPNQLGAILQPAPSPALESCLRLIDVGAYAPGCHLEIVMDDEQGLAEAFFHED